MVRHHYFSFWRVHMETEFCTALRCRLYAGELLEVIAIIGILVALLLPAVQAREKPLAAPSAVTTSSNWESQRTTCTTPTRDFSRYWVCFPIRPTIRNTLSHGGISSIICSPSSSSRRPTMPVMMPRTPMETEPLRAIVLGLAGFTSGLSRLTFALPTLPRLELALQSTLIHGATTGP